MSKFAQDGITSYLFLSHTWYLADWRMERRSAPNAAVLSSLAFEVHCNTYNPSKNSPTYKIQMILPVAFTLLLVSSDHWVQSQELDPFWVVRQLIRRVWEMPSMTPAWHTMGFVGHQRRDPSLLQVLKQLPGSGLGRASKWASQPRLPLADAWTSL